jgi:K+ transporter
VLDLTGGATPTAVLEVLSLIVWTLIPITSIKYVTIAMRVDNDGEGGILALMARLADDGSLQCSKSPTREQFCSVFNGEQA